MKPLIEIIVNKNWEAEPVLNAMTNPKLRPKKLPFPTMINSPKDRNNRMSEPRAKYDLSNITVIVRCIEDLMDPKKNPSSSEEKYRVLPDYIKTDKPDLIISVSTAESVVASPSQNGSVHIGGIFHLYNGEQDNPESRLQISENGELYPCNVAGTIFGLFDSKFETEATKKFIFPVNSPASTLRCYVGANSSAVGVVNVTDYSKYAEADKKALDQFNKIKPASAKAVSIETTHGIVRRSSNSVAPTIPVLFVSPITDRFEHFDDDVTDTQNYIASFNAGIVVGEMLAILNDHFLQ